MGLLAVPDRLVDRVDLLLHHREDLACFFPRRRQNRQRIERGGKALHAVGGGGAIADGLTGNAVEITTQGNHLTIGQRQAVGQVQLDLSGGDCRGVLGET